MSEPTYIQQLLQRHKDGNCTPEEAALLEQWFEQVQRDNNISNMLTAADEERLVARLTEHPRFQLQELPEEEEQRPVVLKRFSPMAAAVWIGGLLIGGLAVWFFIQQMRASSAKQPLVFVEVEAAAGQRRRLVLPDGSVVWLNSRSKLAYHPEFAQNRQVHLTGEAFFEVTHDTKHPFTVEAGSAITKVYGTAFNVNAWPDAGELRVALQRGRIGISNDSASNEKILSPGQLYIYNRQSKTTQLLAENTEDIGGWVSGKLLFNQVPMNEVLVQLEKKYNITGIYTAGTNPKVTARFENVPLKKVLEHLSFGWDIHYKQSGDTLYIK